MSRVIDFYQRRLDKVQEILRPGEALFLNRAPDIFYLTGFTGEDSYLLLTGRDVYFITDGRFTEQAKKESRIGIQLEDIRGNKNLTQILSEIIRDRSVQKILLEKKQVSLGFFENLIADLRGYNAEFSDTPIMKELRMIKDEMEIEIMRENLILTELGYHYIIRVAEEGKTELEIAAELEYFLKKKGAFRMAFDTIVASGARTSLPHGAATGKTVGKDELLMFDFGIVKNGYCSDFTRCYNLGKIIIPKIREIQGIVLEALKTAEAAVRPGVKASAVHQAAYNVIQSAGYEFHFLHSTGHGVGIDIHEFPSISPTGDGELREGMVFTVEPGIYLPEFGGVRLEDMVVVRKNGCEVLTASDYDL